MHFMTQAPCKFEVSSSLYLYLNNEWPPNSRSEPTGVCGAVLEVYRFTQNENRTTQTLLQISVELTQLSIN